MTDRSGLPRRRELLRVVLDRRSRIQSSANWLVIHGSFEEFLAEMEKLEIQSFLLECGPDLAFNALKAGIIDKIVAFIAPKILGGRETPAIGGQGFENLSDVIPLRNWTVTPSATDITITAYVHGNH
jgi:diaminohydroxyphosphoribosylaminopyrimidine deaminase/5-amino-6-(5-phosphoribosylamino)uracil reductase